MQKLLTISIAAYNIEKYIKRTLESCIVPDEYFKYLEVILINDGSSDRTGIIGKEYEKKYPQLIKCIDKENGGYGSTINKAIKLSRGKYFRLLDGDDYFNTDELVSFIDKIKDIDVDLVLNDYMIINQERNKIEKITVFESKEVGERNIYDLASGKNYAMYSFCFKSEILQNNNIEITEKCFYTDLEFILLPLKYCKNFIYFRNYLYSYRIGISEQSVSVVGMKKHYNDAILVTKKLLCYLDELKLYRNLYEIGLDITTMMAKRMYRCVMCRGYSSEVRKLLVELDKYIFCNNIEIYNRVGSSLFIKLMRKIKFHFYYIWVMRILFLKRIRSSNERENNQ